MEIFKKKINKSDFGSTNFEMFKDVHNFGKSDNDMI